MTIDDLGHLSLPNPWDDGTYTIVIGVGKDILAIGRQIDNITTWTHISLDNWHEIKEYVDKIIEARP